MTHTRFRDFTNSELAQMKEASRPREKLEQPCVWCEKIKPMRPDQKFCSASCRAAYSHAAARLTYEKLLQEKEHWQQERAAFILEIAELQRRLQVATASSHIP